MKTEERFKKQSTLNEDGIRKKTILVIFSREI